MDFFLLPEKIKTALPKADAARMRIFNSSGGMDGDSGECYLVAEDAVVHLFHKAFGADEYEDLSVSPSDPGFSMKAVKDKFNTILELSNGAWTHRVKFSSFDASKIEALCASFAAFAPSAPAAATPRAVDASGEVELDPFIGLLAATMFVAGFDGSIDASEDRAIRRLAADDDDVLSAALKVYKSYEAEALSSAMSGLDREARLCVLANMLDVAISDGVLRSSEQRFIETFALGMGLSKDDYLEFRDVLLAKGRSAYLKAARQGAR